MDDEYLRKLVAARLRTIPPNVSFSIGAYGDFTRNELIEAVLKGNDVGKEVVKTELKLLLETPKLAGRLHDSGKTAAFD